MISIGGIEEIIGSIKNNKLKGKKTAVHLKGMGGNDKLTGSKKDDILDGGNGNDVSGKKGADTYVLSSANSMASKVTRLKLTQTLLHACAVQEKHTHPAR